MNIYYHPTMIDIVNHNTFTMGYVTIGLNNFPARSGGIYSGDLNPGTIRHGLYKLYDLQQFPDINLRDKAIKDYSIPWIIRLMPLFNILNKGLILHSKKLPIGMTGCLSIYERESEFYELLSKIMKEFEVTLNVL
jgi:hypothetical protein